MNKLLKIRRENLEDKAINIITKHAKENKNIEIAYSGGKDSDVLLDLCKKANIFNNNFNNTAVVHRFTTLEAKEQIKHVSKVKKECEALGITFIIIRPKKTFYQLVERKGLPTRLKRWCCESLKHNNPYFPDGIVLTGVRKEESYVRSIRVKEKQNINKIVANVNPIMDFKIDYLLDYISKNNIKICELYKTQNRVGCVGCMMAGAKKQTIEFNNNPNKKKAIIKSCDKYLKRVANTRIIKIKKYKEEIEILKKAKQTNTNKKKVEHLKKMIVKKTAPETFKNGEEMVDWWLSGLSIKGWRKEEEYKSRLKNLFELE